MNHSIRGLYKKALVTGGAGFVGSHIVESLLRDGLEVISIDDYSGEKEINLSHLSGNPMLQKLNVISLTMIR